MGLLHKITPLRHAWPGYRKLMSDGKQGEAVILAARSSRYDTTMMRVFRLRAYFDDGTTGEVTRAERDHDVGLGKDVGDTLLVRYDPKHHGRVEIDVPALQDQRNGGRDALAQMKLAAAEQRLGREPPAARVPSVGDERPS